ncbi:MAG: glucan biosynthesis protein G [Gammaproteobacteria bacterium]|nr:MAG: glucan biosynthesis protein G [Gammaproteobacteria bacterium]PIE37395.1 MAG: glucan biosynthesis protein G [Gammaproteobacteria bacterium]
MTVAFAAVHVPLHAQENTGQNLENDAEANADAETSPEDNPEGSTADNPEGRSEGSPENGVEDKAEEGAGDASAADDARNATEEDADGDAGNGEIIVDYSPLPAADADEDRKAEEGGFNFETVARMAEALAAEDYVYVDAELIGTFGDLNYDQYRAIRFKSEYDPWKNIDGFSVDLLPPGLIFHEPVDIYLVHDGVPAKVEFSTEFFDFDPALFPDGVDPDTLGDMGWSGFRLRAPLNRPDVMDEVAVFQGASYFRAVARDTLYGLSARGLAIKTGSREGEEFPIFRSFWLHEPDTTDGIVVINALLDSRSVSGAFEFHIKPGAETLITTRVALFPRVDIDHIGIAPLTSMFWFSPADRAGVDDYRPEVHDSDGLKIINGNGERLWRQLVNPATLQLSAFVDENPVGFGLVQRERDFTDYQDAEARYEKRPSAWIRPQNDWGKGSVVLVEIPVENEFNDNIVTYWQPRETLRPGERYEYRYELGFTDQPPDEGAVAKVIATRAGRSVNDENARSYIIEYPLASLEDKPFEAVVNASRGEVRHVHTQSLRKEGVFRLFFEFVPGDATFADLSARLIAGDEQISETWVMRWTRRR